MLSVLIADDEWIEREGIRSLLQESPYEFQVFMAGNGEEAKKLLEKHKINILFTDIKMPFMDGLDLLEAADLDGRGTKVVMFSAFADFSYAKRAMENHASFYLLKPVDPEEFQKVLAQLVEMILQEWEEERKIRSLTDRLGSPATDWLQGEGPAPKAVSDWMGGGGFCWMQLFDMEGESSGTIAGFYEKIRQFSMRILCMVTVGEGICLVVLKRGNGQERMVSELISWCGMQRACIILSREMKDVESLTDTYQRMYDMLRYHFFAEENQIYYVGEGNADAASSENAVRRIQKEILDGIDNGNYAYVEGNLEALQEEFRGRIHDSQIYVKYLYAGILRKLFEKKEVSHPEFKRCLDSLFAETNLYGIHRMMLETVGRFREGEKEGKKGGAEQKKVIRKVMEIVESRYREELTLPSIAQEVYLTPSYLSYLFKKQTGHSLIKYITTVRLEEAKKLLKGSSLKVSEVAKRVGYQNDSYFNITFKNNLGISPTQYRERRE